MNAKNLLFILAVVIILVIAGILYKYKAGPVEEEKAVRNLSGSLEGAVAETPSVAPSVNPLKKTAPTANPIEKTNPFKFKNEYRNPFE